jgi:outer membrane lipoprotein SlyB
MPWFGDKRRIPVGRRSGLERDWSWSWEAVRPEGARWQRWLWVGGAGAAVAVTVGLTLAFTLGGLGGGPVAEEGGVLPYAAIGGSVSVALHDGQAAKTVIFEDKCDAYLVVRGQDSSPRLPNGDYFFQVTNASGKILLSSDEVRFRQFRVADGAIEGVSGQGRHAVGIDSLGGAATVQLCPFADSPDSSGVYEIWVTRVKDFEGDVQAVDSSAPDSHGFLAARSATGLFGVGPAR